MYFDNDIARVTKKVGTYLPEVPGRDGESSVEVVT